MFRRNLSPAVGRASVYKAIVLRPSRAVLSCRGCRPKTGPIPLNVRAGHACQWPTACQWPLVCADGRPALSWRGRRGSARSASNQRCSVSAMICRESPTAALPAAVRGSPEPPAPASTWASCWLADVAEAAVRRGHAASMGRNCARSLPAGWNWPASFSTFSPQQSDRTTQKTPRPRYIGGNTGFFSSFLPESNWRPSHYE
jgi:hypothetical protein